MSTFWNSLLGECHVNTFICTNVEGKIAKIISIRGLISWWYNFINHTVVCNGVVWFNLLANITYLADLALFKLIKWNDMQPYDVWVGLGIADYFC